MLNAINVIAVRVAINAVKKSKYNIDRIAIKNWKMIGAPLKKNTSVILSSALPPRDILAINEPVLWVV
jgi:hypothetical protein